MSNGKGWTINGGPHRQRTTGPILVKLGGAAIDRAHEHPELFEALGDLHQAARAEGNGEGVVLIHGGGAAVDRRLERLGLKSERRDGIRITPPQHIDEVVAGLAGSVNKQLVGELQSRGVAAVGLCLGDGFVAQCRKATGYNFDPGRVGEVCGGNPRLIDVLLGGGFMPVLCSIGLDDDGQPLNINADDAAAALAGVLDCRELILMTDVPGVLDANGAVIDELTAAEIEQRIASGEIRGGMIPKVRGALQAAQASGVPVTIASWSDPATLRRLSRGEAVGTRIVCHASGRHALSRESDQGMAAEMVVAATSWSDLL
jgi:acetylglutamate kinase